MGQGKYKLVHDSSGYFIGRTHFLMRMAARPRVDILIATYSGNVSDVRQNIPIILDYCQANLTKYHWRITLAYNGRLVSEKELIESFHRFPRVRITHVSRPGKGSAVLNGVLSSTATYALYMDADIATDLEGIPLVLEKLEQGADLVSGSRYHPHSRIARDPLRLFVSWVYTQILLRFFLGAKFSDPQCGFKGFHCERMRPVLSTVEDSWFFFETEFTYAAQRMGRKIVEIPVKWKEMGNSSVKLIPTILNFIRNLLRIRFIEGTPSKKEWMQDPELVQQGLFSK